MLTHVIVSSPKFVGAEMIENRIKALREKKGLSQKQLAALVGTSQQQIQRIETSKQSIRFDMALQVCKALEASMQTVFPQTKETLTQARRRGQTLSDMLHDREFRDELEKVGVDMELDLWFFKYRLRGGAEGIWPVSGPERRRLWRAVQRVDSEQFVVFDSEETKVVLNLNHLTYSHFLFEPSDRGYLQKENKDGEVMREGAVSVYMADSPEPLYFDVDPDWPPEDPAEDEGQLRFLVVVADTIMEDDTNEVFYFMDGDGETAFFRAWDVAMIEIPLRLLEPELLDDDEETNDNHYTNPSTGSN